MEVNMIGSKGTLYNNFYVYNEYERMHDDDKNIVIYTYNAAVIRNNEEISNHYGYLQYVGKGFFFFIPFMKGTNKIGLLKMQMAGDEIVPFSEEIISEDIKEDRKKVIKVLKDNEVCFRESLLDAVFDADTQYFMASYYNVLRISNEAELNGPVLYEPSYRGSVLLPSNFKNPIPKSIIESEGIMKTKPIENATFLNEGVKFSDLSKIEEKFVENTQINVKKSNRTPKN